MEYRISRKRIKGRDLRLANQGDYEANLRLMSSCMVDPATNDFMDKEKAFDLLDEMDVEQQDAEATKFLKTLEEAQKNAVPLANNGR